jgi:predicted dehydrogenase
MSQKLKTVLVGTNGDVFSQLDDVNNAYFEKLKLHINALKKHKNFDVFAIVEKDENIIKLLKNEFENVEFFNSIEECPTDLNPDILSVPINNKNTSKLLKKITPKKAILIYPFENKHLIKCESLIKYCQEKQILAQIDLPKRSDDLFCKLADNKIFEKIGSINFARAIYTGDLEHRGLEMIDLLRMFLGEVVDYSLIEAKDNAISFMLKFENKVSVPVQAINVEKLKEFSVEIWGDNGCLEICDAGEFVRLKTKSPHPKLKNYDVICKNNYEQVQYNTQNATYNLYDNLYQAISHKSALKSDLNNLLNSIYVMDNIITLNNEIGFIINF